MPYDDPDPADPTVLVGVELPGDTASDLEMAWTFAEEFAAMGYSEAQLRALFRTPHYAGAFRAHRVLGEARIEAIIREAVQFWQHLRVSILDAPAGGEIDVPLKALQPACSAGVHSNSEVDDEQRL